MNAFGVVSAWWSAFAAAMVDLPHWRVHNNRTLSSVALRTSACKLSGVKPKLSATQVAAAPS